jgi:co-chaperonin GroES (HSP10)
MACLLAHEAVCEDSVLVVTDTPVEKVGSIIVPDESKNTPLCGVVVLAGREAIEKGPPGLAVGRRVSYSMMAGVGYPFRGNWEARVLRYSEIRIVLRDKSGIPIYRKAMREAKL